MASIDFEGRQLPVGDGDTIASVLQRSGVTVLSRSFKYHRPRGLYCVSGDCPNCMVTVDREPAVRSCVTPATNGQRVARSNGWPSVDHDVLSVTWFMRWALPVGFYYKIFTRPRWLWPLAEKFISRIAGIGPVDTTLEPEALERRNAHPDLAVLGGGVAGLSAALAAAERGESVVLLDEGLIGEQVAPGPVRAAIDTLLVMVRAHPRVTIVERAPVTGVYEGPLVTAAAAHVLHLVHPKRIVVATGAVERHAVFPGSDLPGVWLGRGAARMAGAHGVMPGKQAVVVLGTAESLAHLDTLQNAGVAIRLAVAPAALASRLPKEIPSLVDGEVVEAKGRRHVKAVVVRTPSGGRQVVPCDTLVLSLGFSPRDGLLRQAQEGTVNGAGDAVTPGCSVEEAMASGKEAALRSATMPVESSVANLPPAPTDGIVCICEDVGVSELAGAWREGYTSTEILKRYTTATMGPCQGQMCHAHLRAFVLKQEPNSTWTSAATTARPPARGLTLEQAAAGYDHHLEYRTALHDRHLEMGARMGWAGAWQRPENYGDRVKEYWAVRRHVSIMDVGTLGKYRIYGPDAAEFLDRLYPMHVRTIRKGRSRYGLMLNQAGYIFDDGMVALVAPGDYFVSTTSSGADAAEGWFRDWNDTWKLKVHIVNLTAVLGAINVAGPHARELITRLTKDPIDSAAIPYSGLALITARGIPCMAIRVGFTGELSYELHHPASRSVELWNALLDAGADLEIAPHGLDALKVLRLEKGHVIIGQDTDFDTTPGKIGMQWAVKMDKPYFVGRASLERLAAIPPGKKLVPIRFPGTGAPDEGAQLMAGDARVGYLTSSRYSPLLQCGVSLGWVGLVNGVLPEKVVAVSDKRRDAGDVASGPFYDPEGAKLRA
jgi:sarcosine oxidase, subunit alpha